MRLKSLIFCSIITLLTACSAVTTPQIYQPTQSPQANIQPTRIGLELAPATLGKSISLQQQLTVQRDGHSYQLDTVLEVNTHHLDLVGLMMGQRIMTLHYDGKTLHTWRDPRLPPQISGQNVLEDIELTLWPVDVLRKSLPVGWSIQDQTNLRTIFLDKKPVVVIHYLNKNRFTGTTVLKNLRYHYQLKIQSARN